MAPRSDLDLPGQEVGVILTSHLVLKISGGKLILVALGCLGGQLSSLLLEQAEGICLVDGFALGGLDAVPDPLPELGPGDLGSGGVLHEVVDGHTANATEPTFHITQANVEVLANSVLGDGAGHVHVEEIVGGDMHVLPAFEELVGSRHVLVEDFGSDGGQGRVSDPGAVVTSPDFAELVLSDAVHGLVVGFLVVLDGDLGGHATHGVYTTTMAGLDEQSDVGVHERDGHGDSRSIWEDKVGVLSEFLDDGEDVIPPTTVEAGRMVAKLIDDFVHLKGRSDGLDQHGASDGAAGHADVVLGEVEDVVPQSSLEMRLHLGQVEVGSVATLDELKGVVEKVETKVEKGARDGLAVDGEMLLLQMPSSSTANQGGQHTIGAQFIFFLSLLEVDLSSNGVVQVDLARDLVVPGGGSGVYSIIRVSWGSFDRGVGVMLPSKSAIYVQTLLFKALTTILRSVGPVISMRRSTRPGAGGAPFQESLSRMCLVSGRNSGRTPLSSSCWRITRR